MAQKWTIVSLLQENEHQINAMYRFANALFSYSSLRSMFTHMYKYMNN